MTFEKAKNIHPNTDSVMVKKTGEKMVVSDKIVHYPDGLIDEKFVLLMCNNGVWYSHTEVNIY